MRALQAIYLRELQAYFHSAIAYVLWVGFLLLSGFFFYSGTMYYGMASLQAMRNPMGGGLNLHDMLVAPLLGNMSVIQMLVAPLLTMRLLSEEKRAGTLELLLSYPLSDLSVVLGKFLAALSMLALILAPTLLHMIILAWLGPLYWPTVLLGYLGLLLLGAGFIALGLLASALTENQIVAAVTAFAGLLLLWVLRWSSSLAGESWGPLLQGLSLSAHFENLAKGLLDSADIAYFVLFVALFLFASIRALEAKRWKS
ncbi:MAG: ABC transporter permease [Pseudomonadota bacterium]